MSASNIAKLRSLGEYDEGSDFDVVYRAMCCCSDFHHDQILRLSCNETFGILELTIDHEMWYPDWNEENWFKKIWQRIKVSLRLLFTGYVELNGGFMFSGQEAIKDYITALQDGLQKLNKDEIKITTLPTPNQKVIKQHRVWIDFNCVGQPEVYLSDVVDGKILTLEGKVEYEVEE